MKHVIACLVALGLFTSTQSIAGENDMNKEQLAVMATITKMTDAFQNKNIKDVMATYEPLATVAFEPGVPVSDRGQLEQMFIAMSGMNPEFDFSGHEVIVNGDIAVHITPWEMTGQMPDGQKVEQAGLSVAVLRKQADGQWLMVIDNPHGQRQMQ